MQASALGAMSSSTPANPPLQARLGGPRPSLWKLFEKRKLICATATPLLSSPAGIGEEGRRGHCNRYRVVADWGYVVNFPYNLVCMFFAIFLQPVLCNIVGVLVHVAWGIH